MKIKRIIKGYKTLEKRFYDEETYLDDDIYDYFLRF